MAIWPLLGLMGLHVDRELPLGILITSLMSILITSLMSILIIHLHATWQYKCHNFCPFICSCATSRCKDGIEAGTLSPHPLPEGPSRPPGPPWPPPFLPDDTLDLSTLTSTTLTDVNCAWAYLYGLGSPDKMKVMPPERIKGVLAIFQHICAIDDIVKEIARDVKNGFLHCGDRKEEYVRVLYDCVRDLSRKSNGWDDLFVTLNRATPI